MQLHGVYLALIVFPVSLLLGPCCEVGQVGYIYIYIYIYYVHKNLSWRRACCPSALLGLV